MAEQSNLDEFFNTVELFSQNTGLKLNYDKTQILRMGSLKNSQAELIMQKVVSWSRRVKILGMWFTTDKDEMNSLNYEKLKEKISKILNNWQARGLTILGKITVINTLVVPQFVYYFINTYNPPETFFEYVDQVVKKFLWNGGPARIKYQVLQQDIEKGGLKLVNIRNKCISLKAKWVKETFGSKAFWALHGSNTLPLVADVTQCNLSKKHASKLLGQGIYADVIKAWLEYKHQSLDEVVKDCNKILNQTLWYNSHILVGKRPCNVNKLYSKNICKIKDVYDMQNRRFYKWEELVVKYRVESDFLQYHAVIAAIPKTWKEKLQNTIDIDESDIFETAFEVQKISSYIYKQITYKENVNDTGKLMWEKELKCSFDDNWEKIRRYTFQLTPLTKLRYFQYRLLSFKLITNYHRSKWDNTVTAYCPFCERKLNTTVHLFIECSNVVKLWTGVTKWLGYMLKSKVTLTNAEIIMNNYQGQFKDTVNTVILIAKQYVYASCCMNEKISFMDLALRVQDYRKIEKITQYKLKKSQKYYEKWNMFE